MRRHALPSLGVPLLAAVLLHGLWLSFNHLQRSRLSPPAKLSARDDTADLLQLSRRLPDEQEMGTVPLPPQLTLPPPPPELLSALPPPPETAKRRAAAGAVATKKGSLRLALPPRRPGATRAVSPGAKPPGRPATARVAESAPLGPLATLLALRDQVALPAATAESALQAATGESPLLLRPEGETADSFRKLWEGARSDSTPSGELGDLPETVELRELPLTQARGAGLNPSHRQAVVLADHLILFWIDNSTLWMLRSPTTPG